MSRAETGYTDFVDIVQILAFNLCYIGSLLKVWGHRSVDLNKILKGSLWITLLFWEQTAGCGAVGRGGE